MHNVTIFTNVCFCYLHGTFFFKNCIFRPQKTPLSCKGMAKTHNKFLVKNGVAIMYFLSFGGLRLEYITHFLPRFLSQHQFPTVRANLPDFTENHVVQDGHRIQFLNFRLMISNMFWAYFRKHVFIYHVFPSNKTHFSA